MPENPTDIRSQLELYLRKELDPTRMSEVKHYIDTDPLWSSTYEALQTESQGIRLSTLHDLQAQLRALEASTQKIENNGHTPGDLSPSPTSTHEQNDTEHLESIEATPVHLLDIPPDPRMLQGIRYTTLHDELKKLQSTEQQQGGEGDIKKNGPAGSGGRVVGMRRWWWAVAAGVVVIAGYFYLDQNKKPKYVNQYLLDHFDEYVLHDKVRGTAPVDSFDRDKEIGYDLYVLQEFEEAIPYLEKRWERKRDTLALFYLGVCYISLNNKSKSNEILNKNELNKFYNLYNKIKLK